jgi:tRNA(Arg) A34 adenosine deaminase TadA
LAARASGDAVTLRLPSWVGSLIGDGSRIHATPEERMDLAIRLAQRNVEEDTGGPFGACVFESETGRIVAAGVNVVVTSRCSVAHAEAMAIMIAQRRRGAFDLGAPGQPRMELVTSAQPCIQCYGVIWWSGVARLVVGADADDVRSIAGFEEGPLPPGWADRLRHRPPLPPVEVATGCLRDRAREVLRRYRDSGGPIYNPGSGLT